MLFMDPRDLPSVTPWISLPGHLPHVLPVASTHYPSAAAQALHRIDFFPRIHIIRKVIVRWQTLTRISL